MSPWLREIVAATLLVGSLVAMGLAGFAFSGSRKTTARPFALFQIGIAIWCFLAYLQLRTRVPFAQLSYYKFSYIGMLLVPPAALAFGRTVFGKPFGPRAVLLLAIVPGLMAFLFLYNDSRLFWTYSRYVTAIVVRLGPFF